MVLAEGLAFFILTPFPAMSRAAGLLAGAGRLAYYSSWLSPYRRMDIFVVVWLLGEIAAYFILTPFPAVRRVMGVMVAGTILYGRLGAARTCVTHTARAVLWGITGYGILLGLGVFWVDLHDAYASKDLAERAARIVRERAPQARIWYDVGHWGFQYYAEHAGMVPVVPGGYVDDKNQPIPGSHLEVGDRPAVPDSHL